ncbi:MAG: DUF4338 domain-containing protein [Planctomycetia bacterium]|nr:DUF4338 domain-containing protein [Planctomycetia bacterium]
MLRVGGRIFSDDVIKRLSETIQKEPCLSRRKLSRLVCEWMDWRNQAGRLQEMSCRKALLELDRRKEINLPKVNKHYAFQKSINLRRRSDCGSVMRASGVGDVEIIRVTTRFHSKLWRSMLEAHHLGSEPSCGAQLRYLVRSEHYGWIGGLVIVPVPDGWKVATSG